jgi:formylmethanofuran dehydrogenase subunit E
MAVQKAHDPRAEIRRALEDKDLEWLLKKTGEIHGHFCPGSALGVMASVYGLTHPEMGFTPSDGMEGLVAVVETNSCFADGVQMVSGCTIGNNCLVYRDLGKTAVTFAQRGRGTGIRVRVRPDFRSFVEQAVPEFFPLMEKVVKNRTGSEEEVAAFKAKGAEAGFALIQAPLSEVLIAEKVTPTLPGYAPIIQSIVCPGCGETLMATKTVTEGEGKGICFMCARKEYRQVEGQGIVIRSP